MSIPQQSLLLLAAVWLLISASCSPKKPLPVVQAEQSLPETVDYNFDVKPILSDKCFQCHGPDEDTRKGGLRLDTREGALEKNPGSGKRAIVPENISASEVFHRLVSDNPEYMMPSPASKMALTDREKAIIIRWIEQGAEYKPHWAFVPPVKAETGLPNNATAPQTIDYFVQNKLSEKGLSPAEIAPKETLVRRAYFTLTGLPPSLEQTDRFVDDKSPEAWEKLIDSLLASPAYGERMAAVWMDVARYADSDGYLDDKHRDFSPWRDWVIESFNQNMPYNEFVSMQLAGDLFPNATLENKLATAFNRLHKKNSEAGIVFEEYLAEYVADRTNTLGTAFLGLSLDCARCHDHKYDPVSQEDYYKLAGFFNSTNEIGTPVYGPDQTPAPALLLAGEKEAAWLDSVEQVLKQLDKKLEDRSTTGSVGFHDWKNSQQNLPADISRNLQKSLAAHYSFDRLITDGEGRTTAPDLTGKNKPARVSASTIKEGTSGKAFFADDYQSVILGEKVGWYEKSDPFSLSFQIFPDTVYNDVGVLFHCEDFRLGMKGYSIHLDKNRVRFIMAHSWPENAIEIITDNSLKVKQWSHLSVTYDGSGKASGVHIYIDGALAKQTVVTDNLYKGILYEPDIHTYGFAGVRLGYRDKFDLFKYGGLDEIKIYDGALTPLEAAFEYDPEKAVGDLLDKGTKTDDPGLAYYLKYYDKPYQAIQKEQKLLRDSHTLRSNSIPEIMVMGDLAGPRKTYVLERGLYNARGKEVKPGVPEEIFPYNEDYPSDRSGLVNWLFDKKNPLTARVFVNRIWQMHFGRGIVKTSEDFGAQGDSPTHPELLDWLAVDFMESGWDIKDLHKKILSSSTYQQSSVISKDAWQKDPENVWLARGPRFRLPAEMIRDNALAISGLLVDKQGGESVYPYQPVGLWDELSNKSWRYPYLQEPGEGLYRRSLYTVWKRTSPPPSMLIFDVADRSGCVVRRKNTSTPLQALVLLNDPQYIEAARAMAERLVKIENGPEQQMIKAFRLVTGRQPVDAELSDLNEFYRQEHGLFALNGKKANNYLSVGERAWDKTHNAAELAALATVINALMNTYESYMLN